MGHPSPRLVSSFPARQWDNDGASLCKHFPSPEDGDTSPLMVGPSGVVVDLSSRFGGGRKSDSIQIHNLGASASGVYVHLDMTQDEVEGEMTDVELIAAVRDRGFMRVESETKESLNVAMKKVVMTAAEADQEVRITAVGRY